MNTVKNHTKKLNVVIKNEALNIVFCMLAKF